MVEERRGLANEAKADVVVEGVRAGSKWQGREEGGRGGVFCGWCILVGFREWEGGRGGGRWELVTGGEVVGEAGRGGGGAVWGPGVWVGVDGVEVGLGGLSEGAGGGLSRWSARVGPRGRWQECWVAFSASYWSNWRWSQ